MTCYTTNISQRVDRLMLLQMSSMRDAYADALLELGSKDPRVVVPADASAIRALVSQSWRTPGPFYIRLSRATVPEIYSSPADLEIGRAEVLREGSDVAIIACGVMVNEAVEAAELLSKEGISAQV